MTLEEAMNKRPPQWLIDWWNDAFLVKSAQGQEDKYKSRFGQFNEATLLFEGNGLTDITTLEAIEIFKAIINRSSNGSNSTFTLFGNRDRIRTMPPTNVIGRYSRDTYTDLFNGCSNIESVRFLSYDSNFKIEGTFCRCSKLKTIYGMILNSYCSVSDTTFSGCTALEDFSIGSPADVLNLKLGGSPKLSYNTVSMLANKLKAQSTVTLHTDVYAALTGEAASYPVNGGSQEQWEALIETAASRNIIFVSA